MDPFESILPGAVLDASGAVVPFYAIDQPVCDVLATMVATMFHQARSHAPVPTMGEPYDAMLERIIARVRSNA